MIQTKTGASHLPGFSLAQGEMAQRCRVHDWANSPLGSTDAWPENLLALVGVMLASTQPMFIVWGPKRTTLYNDAYGAVLADKHPALGLPFEDIWQEIWDEDLEPIVARAYAGEALHMDDIPLTLMRKGYPEETHFSFSYTPVFGEDGKAEGFFCPCLEITDQILEERRVQLRAAMTERLRELDDTGEIRRAAAALIGSHLSVQRVQYAELDSRQDCVVVESLWSVEGAAGHPARYLVQEVEGPLFDDLSAGMSFQTPCAMTDPRFSARKAGQLLRKTGTGAMLAVPVRHNGSVSEALILIGQEPRIWHPGDVAIVEEMAARIAEASERARLGAARRADEKVLQETRDSLALATAASQLGAGQWNFSAGTITLDDLGRRIMGLEDWEDRIDQWIDRTHPDDRAKLLAELGSCVKDDRPFDLQYRVLRRDGLIRHVHGIGQIEADANQNPFSATGFVRDVTELVEAEQHQNLLMAELDHRVKNILALVQSIAQMSLRKETGGTSAAGTAFIGRIRALAQSHALLANSRWTGADLSRLVQTIAEPYRGKPRRIDIAGRDLKIAPRAAQTLALALHELLTNAAKHGALSTDAGTVAATWDIVGHGTDQHLIFTWQERGGPVLAGAPMNKGFGSLLIKEGLTYEFQGSVDLDFAASGLTATITLPLAKIAASGGQPTEPLSIARRADIRNDASLAGASILIVEDDLLVATRSEETIRAAGAKVFGPAGHLEDALRHAVSGTFDCALLDINLHGSFVWPVARALQARGIPFVFATGYSDLLAFPDDLADVGRIEKPFDAAQLRGALELALSRGSRPAPPL